MRIGYACQTLGVQSITYRSCTRRNATETLLADLIAHNLQSLEKAVEYNIRNDIRLFRISSDLIPFGSSPVNQLAWRDIFAPQLQRIGGKIRLSGLRVSMHPGQYTVLNSPDSDVVRRAAADLDYHRQVLDSLGVGPDHKIILHIGGLYQDRANAVRRFIQNWQSLAENIRQRLVIENDDHSFSINEVLMIGRQLQIPVVFDNLHHQLNPADSDHSDAFWIASCRETWSDRDGRQKIHYSQQDPLKKNGSHAATIQIQPFLSFWQDLMLENRDDLDIMLEVKDKNLSARKCILCTTPDRRMNNLETEWSRYKYKVLENSPHDYQVIRQLLNNKKTYPCLEFYTQIEHAQTQTANPGFAVNAALHVWGYFKKLVSEQEKGTFFHLLANFSQGKTSIRPVKNFLWKMTVQYDQPYLADSTILWFNIP